MTSPLFSILPLALALVSPVSVGPTVCLPRHLPSRRYNPRRVRLKSGSRKIDLRLLPFLIGQHTVSFINTLVIFYFISIMSLNIYLFLVL